MIFDADDLTAWGFSAVAGVIAILAMVRTNAHGTLGWKRASGIILVASGAMLLVACAVVYASGEYHAGHGSNSLIVLVFFAVIIVMKPAAIWLVVGFVVAGILKSRSARFERTHGSPT
jgi:hypothetical protein